MIFSLIESQLRLLPSQVHLFEMIGNVQFDEIQNQICSIQLKKNYTIKINIMLNTWHM
jgi:hypothetical protein